MEDGIRKMAVPDTYEEEHKITINLAAEDGKTYAVVEFLERGALCD